MMISAHLLFLTGAFSAATLSFDRTSILSAANAATDRLLGYYTQNSEGAFPQNADGSGVQWYESGVLWGIAMDHVVTAGDERYLGTIGGVLLLHCELAYF